MRAREEQIVTTTERFDAVVVGCGVAGAAFEPEGGYADPQVATDAFVAAFREKGGALRTRTPVRGLLREGDRVTGVQLDDGPVHAGWVVNAAGPWAAPLAASANIGL